MLISDPVKMNLDDQYISILDLARKLSFAPQIIQNIKLLMDI